MPRRSAQQRMTSSDLEWPFRASRAISAIAELLVDMLACSVKVGCCGCWRTVTVHRQAGTRTVGYTAAAAAATECTIRHRLRGGRTDRQQRRIYRQQI